MIKRLIIFLSCTVLSILPLLTSFKTLPRKIAHIIAKFGIDCSGNSWCEEELFSNLVFGVLAWCAWVLYFIINYRWVRFGYVQKNIRIAGALIGICALLSAHIYGVILVLPAVLLMLYIHFRVPHSAPA